MKRSSILIIDHEDRENLKERLEKNSNFTVVGATNNMDIGFTLAERLQPGLIILNVDLPGNEGMAIAEVFALEFPASSLILTTASDSKRVLRYAMRVGAKEVINLPIDDDKLFRLLSRVVLEDMRRQELVSVEKKAHPQFKTITVFSTKGGVGKTTIALNLALAIQKTTKKKTVLLDLNLMAGNIALMAGVTAKLSIKDFIDDISTIDEENIDNYCIIHSSGLRIIPAPSNPEMASFVTAEDIEKVLDLLSRSYNYVIIDAPNYFHDTVIPSLEKAKDILVVSTLDLAAVQNLKQCLGLFESLNVGNKARVIVNKSGNSSAIKVKHLEGELGLTVLGTIPDCEKQAINAIDIGVPMILSAKGSPASRAIEDLSAKLVNNGEKAKALSGWRKILG